VLQTFQLPFKYFHFLHFPLPSFKQPARESRSSQQVLMNANSHLFPKKGNLRWQLQSHFACCRGFRTISCSPRTLWPPTQPTSTSRFKPKTPRPSNVANENRFGSAYI